MKSDLVFLTAETLETAHCGDSLETFLSSKDMRWRGIILEQGFSPSFYPKDSMTPYFYFALGMEWDLGWRITSEKTISELITHPDEIWFNPPYTVFSYDVKKPFYFVTLAVESERMFDALDKDIEPGAVEFLNNYGIVDPLLKNMIELFYLEALGGGKRGSGFIDSILGTLADYFFWNYSNYPELINDKSIRKSRLSERDLKKVDEFCEIHIGEPFSLEALASLVNMNLFYFSREFKKSRGMTPHQYFIRRKVDKGKKMVEGRHLTVQPIAYDPKFKDQSRFPRTFKREEKPCRHISLTKREQEVLLWVAGGKTKPEIAEILLVSESCIKRHCENIFRKLETGTLAFAVAKAIRWGLIDPF